MRPVRNTDEKAMPEPIGTIILLPFRVTDYAPDPEGYQRVCLENLDKEGHPTGWEIDGFSLRSDKALVVTTEELQMLFSFLGAG